MYPEPSFGGEQAIPSHLAAALDYARRGWRVFPLWPVLPDGTCACGRDCGAVGKHPRIKRWPKRATTDPGVLRDWWARWPDAVVAIATGAGSGLVVLDIEGEGKPSGISGYAALVALQRAHGMLPATLTASTPSGGHHVFLQHPGGKVKNSTGELGQGVDVRGDGGMVVPPPAPGRNWTVAVSPAPMPATWAALVVVPDAPDGPDRPDQGGDAGPAVAAEPCPPGSATTYGQAALADELEHLAKIPEGKRNHALNRAAFKVGQLVAAGEVALDLALDELEAAGLALGLTPGEVAGTVRSGLESGQRKPRPAPEPPRRRHRRPTTRPTRWGTTARRRRSWSSRRAGWSGPSRNATGGRARPAGPAGPRWWSPRPALPAAASCSPPSWARWRSRRPPGRPSVTSSGGSRRPGMTAGRCW
jgi:Bifunctional DNA primase/polymerase, N-terminal